MKTCSKFWAMWNSIFSRLPDRSGFGGPRLYWPRFCVLYCKTPTVLDQLHIGQISRTVLKDEIPIAFLNLMHQPAPYHFVERLICFIFAPVLQADLFIVQPVSVKNWTNKRKQFCILPTDWFSFLVYKDFIGQPIQLWQHGHVRYYRLRREL